MKNQLCCKFNYGNYQLPERSTQKVQRPTQQSIPELSISLVQLLIKCVIIVIRCQCMWQAPKGLF